MCSEYAADHITLFSVSYEKCCGRARMFRLSNRSQLHGRSAPWRDISTEIDGCIYTKFLRNCAFCDGFRVNGKGEAWSKTSNWDNARSLRINRPMRASLLGGRRRSGCCHISWFEQGPQLGWRHILVNNAIHGRK